LALVERARGGLPVTVQADLLSLSRSSLYYRPVGPSPEEVALKHRIDTIYTQYPFFGSRRIAALLRRDGVVLNRKAVQRHMRERGIAGIHPGPNTSKRRLEHRVYPYLLRDVTSAYPNHVWGIDITYIRLQRGWMYLVAVLDWYSRYVVSWALDQTLELPFVLAAVEQALGQAAPAIWNSDQGSHFTSPQYLALLAAADVQVSMDGKGRALDNIFTERLWRTVKYEEVYLQDYATPKDARQGLTRYLDFYNHTRPHQALGYRTPADVYGAAPAYGRAACFARPRHSWRRAATSGAGGRPKNTTKEGGLSTSNRRFHCLDKRVQHTIGRAGHPAVQPPRHMSMTPKNGREVCVVADNLVVADEAKPSTIASGPGAIRVQRVSIDTDAVARLGAFNGEVGPVAHACPPFTACTTARSMRARRSSSLSLARKAAGSITSGAPTTMSGAPAAGSLGRSSRRRPPTACTGSVTAETTAARSSQGLAPLISPRSSKPVCTMMTSTPSRSHARAVATLSGAARMSPMIPAP